MQLSTCDHDFFYFRCGIHTLQLAINNILKGDNNSFFKEYPTATPLVGIIKSDLCTCKVLIKQLRFFKYRKELEDQGVPIPILPNETRWNSIYSMIASLIEVKDFLQSGFIEDEQLIYEESLFSHLNALVDVLVIFSDINKPMQRDFLPYSECYLMWEFAKENLININDMFQMFSNVFVQSMHFREEI